MTIKRNTHMKRTSHSGIALVIVLAMLVLLSALVVAFMVSVKTDLSASQSYQGGVTTRVLADSAVNLVIGQIREGSTQEGKAWISQPGLVRTFTVDGVPSQAFKLYSAETMVEGTSFDPTKSEDKPSETSRTSPGHWSRQPALWTDLNGPATNATKRDSDGKPLMVFPILDGNHFNSLGEMALNGVDKSVEGFWIDEYKERDVEMPVRWLYMLQDGTIAPGTKGVNPNEAIVKVATKENPVVARMAFWTDDESAKVNINTASEGTFWDTPVCNTQPGVAVGSNDARKLYVNNVDRVYEWDLAERIGAVNEFQRYPGHPATTCLSPIFGLELAKSLKLTKAQTLEGVTRSRYVEEFMKIAPRVAGKNHRKSGEAVNQDYSSRGGTVRAGTDQRGNWQLLDATAQIADVDLRRVIKDGDRLYATVDELAFKPLEMNPSQPNERGPTLLAKRGNDDKSREMIEMTRFLITANSKAPEQNLFNLPRVAVWPVRDEENRRTSADKLIAFSTTVGDKSVSGVQFPMIVQRSDPASSTYDYNNIPNNQRLYSYLQSLMSRPIVGWAPQAGASPSFAGKYGDDSDQILTEIFDYIRCTNLVDQSDRSDKLNRIPYTNPKIGGIDSCDIKMRTKRGHVLPLVIREDNPATSRDESLRGFGRIPTISELALVMINKTPNPNTPNQTIEASLLPELFSPMAGFSALTNDIRIEFSDMRFEVRHNGPGGVRALLFPRAIYPAIYDVGRITSVEDHESKVGGIIGVRSLLEPATDRYPPNSGSPNDSCPPTAEFVVPKAATKLFITVGRVTVKIFSPGDPKHPIKNLIQEFRFVFPDFSVPVPRHVAGEGEMATGGSPGVPSKVKGERFTNGQYQNMIFRGDTDGDVVRSVMPVGAGIKGDMRLIAARSIIAQGIFSSSGPRYAVDTYFKAHSLRSGWDKIHEGARHGTLVNPTGTGVGMDQYNISAPDIPEGISGVTNSAGQPGDWDNGAGWIVDGAYVNKADEGSARHRHGQSGGMSTFADEAPYIGWGWAGQDFDGEESSFFAPNKQIASPVMLGSLSTGVKANKPWQTLLFRPAKAYLPGGPNHPGSARTGPPDHLLLDLFWMPVAEPYAISEPFATAGKINLNTQVVPFTNIKRHTGLHAVLKSSKITALNPNQQDNRGRFVDNYKRVGSVGASMGDEGGGQRVPVRRNIDIENTIRQITDRLDKNKPFVSASEICDIPLIPANMPELVNKPNFTKTTKLTEYDTKLRAFWDAHKLTGDNSLERPYSTIYPRLTTRSNTYTVHLRVQSLRKVRGGTNDPTVFTEGRDLIAGDFRGSFVVERYLDPNTAGFVRPDGSSTTELDPSAVLGPYRFRVVSSKQFTP